MASFFGGWPRPGGRQCDDALTSAHRIMPDARHAPPRRRGLMRSLLDVSVLMALLDAGRVHHAQAHGWLELEE
jgi:hypothetical protein